ncbi:hypothetical protein IW262DRAFT_1302352 [Armillaria fumosa]|nr:hypothetical protein IW262DRAFT_1302352 [Armillaria fumosa]
MVVESSSTAHSFLGWWGYPLHAWASHSLAEVLVKSVSAHYFELTTRNTTPTGELIRAMTKAHDYLDAHMDILANFNFADSCYGLVLHAAIGLLVSHIPEDLRRWEWNKWALKVPESSRHDYQLDEVLLLPREDGYEAHSDNSVLESDVRPFCIITLPPPRCPTATPSPTFSAPGKKLISVILPPMGSTLGGPNTRKHQREQEAVTNTPMPLSNVHLITGASSSEKVAGPSQSKPSPVPARSHTKSTEVPASRADKVVITTKKPTFDPSSDSEAPELSVDGEGPGDDLGPLFYLMTRFRYLLQNAVCIALPGREELLPPPPHAYQSLTGEPLPGLRSFFKGKRQAEAGLPSRSGRGTNTSTGAIRMRTFISSDLPWQYWQGTGAPCARLNQSWTLFCPMDGRPAACRAATLLDPVTLSGDGGESLLSFSLFLVVSLQIEGINTQLELLDCEQVISELADDLDAITVM